MTDYQSGFGCGFETEALSLALPADRKLGPELPARACTPNIRAAHRLRSLPLETTPVRGKRVRQPSACAMDSKPTAVDAGCCGQEPQR
jgi:hypothetical protein